MTTPTYKLHYFALRMRGEPIRLLLHYLQQPFEDVTFDYMTEWTALKPKFPLRQVPVLEVTLTDGKSVIIGQTTAILRYIAKKHGLQAVSDEDQALCDMYAEQIQDYFTKFTRWWAWLWLKLGTEEERDKYYETDLKPAFDEFGELYSELLQNNKSGFLVGPKVTWLDVFVAHFVDYMPMTTKNPELFAKFPLIQQHYKKVFALPTIAEYVKKRADYPF